MSRLPSIFIPKDAPHSKPVDYVPGLSAPRNLFLYSGLMLCVLFLLPKRSSPGGMCDSCHLFFLPSAWLRAALTNRPLPWVRSPQVLICTCFLLTSSRAEPVSPCTARSALCPSCCFSPVSVEGEDALHDLSTQECWRAPLSRPRLCSPVSAATRAHRMFHGIPVTPGMGGECCPSWAGTQRAQALSLSAEADGSGGWTLGAGGL